MHSTETKYNVDVRKKISWKIVLYVVISVLISSISGLYIGCSLDINSNLPYYKIKTITRNTESFLESLFTISTIIAAAVTFFYSVQDNKKEGIPHRAIMAYSFGSYTVPCLFVGVLIMLPVNYIIFYIGNWVLSWVAIIFTYLIDLLIIAIILLSTSHQYSLHAIGNAEIRQYNRLCEIYIQEPCMQEKTSYIWAYLLNYLEQALLSDELFSDRMEMARRLLRVPFYEKEIGIINDLSIRINKISKKGNPQISLQKLNTNTLKALYSFYYQNILTIFQRSSGSYNTEQRSKIYLVLYEFMEDLTTLFKTGQSHSNRNLGRPYYSMTLCGIMNAVMDSNVEDSESFCNYILNNIVHEKIRRLQIGLYIFFQEYLYRTNRNAIRLDMVAEIDGIKHWKYQDMSAEELDICKEFWNIWTDFSTLSNKNFFSHQYFIRAIHTLQGKSPFSEPIVFIQHVIKRCQENTR